MKAVFFNNRPDGCDRVFGAEQKALLAERYGVVSTAYTRDDIGRIRDAEYIFSTWGMPSLTEEEIKKYLPKLKAIFYAAGSVKGFAEPFLRCGVRIFSAWHANAVPVVECSVAMILLANKGFFYLARGTKNNYAAAHSEIERFTGNFRARVGILGTGAIGMRVLHELKRHDVDLYVFSPEVDEARARELGVTAASLEEIFDLCPVISNHLANVPETVGMLHGDLFGRMKPYSTFINTGRGAQVVESDLIAALQSDPTLTAILDVTDPEPPREGSLFYTLPNVILTPHSAGSSGLEVQRMAQYMIEEAERFEKAEAPLYEVTLPMLKTMA